MIIIYFDIFVLNTLNLVVYCKNNFELHETLSINIANY